MSRYVVEPLPSAESPRLAPKQGAALLAIARQSLEAYLLQGSLLDYQLDEDPELLKPGAAFVTLTCGKRLRGCVGYTEPLYPLHRTVAMCALAAATEDYRFSPVRGSELAEITLSVSVLSPFRKVDDPEQILVGRHGLLVTREGQRGLLLPQVAAEQRWDRETFLEETCRKAGLAAEAWKEPGVEIFLFEAQVFGEERDSPLPYGERSG